MSHFVPLRNHATGLAFITHIFIISLIYGVSFIWNVKHLNLFAYATNYSPNSFWHCLQCSILTGISIDWKCVVNYLTSSSHEQIDLGGRLLNHLNALLLWDAENYCNVSFYLLRLFHTQSQKLWCDPMSSPSNFIKTARLYLSGKTFI